MSDDMRMRATVVDQASGPIRDIGRAVRDVARSSSIAPLQREFSNLHGGLAAVGREIRSVTVPALASLGLTGGGAIASAVGLAKALSSLAERQLDLRFLSREIGLASREIKAFSEAAEKMRIAPDAAQQGLRTFARNVEDIKLNIEGVRETLIQHGAADVVGALQKSKTNYEALAVVVERMQAISRKNPAAGRRFAEAMFGDPAFARMTIAEITAALGKFKDQTEAEAKAAEQFTANMIDLQNTLKKLQITVGNELMPTFTEMVKEVDKFFSQEGVGKFLKGEIEGITKGIRDTVQEVKDLYAFWQRIKSSLGFGAGGGALAKIGEAAEIQERLREKESQYAGTEQQARAWENSGRGDLPMSLRDRRKALADEIQQLKDQLKILREEIEKTNSAAKKTSLYGGGMPAGGGFGGLVVPASLGGAGGFGGGGGGDVMRGLGGLPGMPGGAAAPGRSPGGSGATQGSLPAGGLGDAESFDRTFKGTALEGKWAQVEAAAKENGVPPSVMAAIMAHETGRGSNLRGNNVAGLMDPSTNWMRKQQFGSIDDGIASAGKTIGKNWKRSGGDLDRMGRIYAPPGAANDPRGQNSGWAAGVRRYLSGSARGAAAAAGKGALVDPVTGTSLGGGVGGTSASMGRGRHQGDDIMAPAGSSVRASKDGVIERIGTDNWGTPAVTVRHPDGTYSRYLHLGEVQSKVGDEVKGGQQIGLSGRANGVAHLHYEMWRGRPNRAGSQLLDPRQIHGWNRNNLPQAGRAVPGTGEPTTAGPPLKQDQAEKQPWPRVLPGRGEGPAFPRGVTPDDGRERMDRALSRMSGLSGSISGSASIDVTVKAPKGTVVGAGANGIFKDVKINRSTQMAPAAEGPSEDGR